jgi:hypothetical protein
MRLRISPGSLKNGELALWVVLWTVSNGEVGPQSDVHVCQMLRRLKSHKPLTRVVGLHSSRLSVDSLVEGNARRRREGTCIEYVCLHNLARDTKYSVYTCMCSTQYISRAILAYYGRIAKRKSEHTSQWNSQGEYGFPPESRGWLLFLFTAAPRKSARNLPENEPQSF